MKKSKGQSQWISLADLMTGLTMVFIIIVVSMQYHPLIRYENTKTKIYESLEKTFFQEIKSKKIEITKDLAIRFLDFSVLFEKNKMQLSSYYKAELNRFIPKFIDVLQNNKNNILSVRIEGHTGGKTQKYYNYINLVNLSMGRSLNILYYFVNNKKFKSLSALQQKNLKFKLTATGYGNGRMIDSNGNYIIKSKKKAFKTRRVEFRILINTEKI